MHQSASGHHLGVQDSFFSQRAVKRTAMAISPLHHWSYSQAFLLSISHSLQGFGIE